MKENRSETVISNNARFNLSLNESRELINEGKFKDAITLLATFINNEESLDSVQKEKLISWSLPYRRNNDLSKAGVEQYIERISKYF